MSDLPGLGAGVGAQNSALDRQTEQLLKHYGSLRNSTALTGGAPAEVGRLGADKNRIENARIDKSAGDFESILLGTWLQQAEQSFAKVPGGDGEDGGSDGGDGDADPGSEQLQGMAVQSLAGALTASGGIGIAKMIARQLHRSDLPSQDASPTAPTSKTPASAAAPARPAARSTALSTTLGSIVPRDGIAGPFPPARPAPEDISR